MTLPHNKLLFIINYLFFFFILIVICGCSDESSKLEEIKLKEKIRIALVENPPHYFPDKNKGRGYDFELASHYATSIGVDLEIITTKTSKDIFSLLNKNKADIGITSSSPKFVNKNILSAITYNNNEWYVIGSRENNKLPTSIEKIRPDTLIVGKDSNASLVLQKIKKDYSSLQWNEFKNISIRKILEKINKDKTKISIVSSDIYTYYQYLFPETKKIFVLPVKYPSRWLINNDSSFLYSINSFFNEYKRDGKIQ